MLLMMNSEETAVSSEVSSVFSAIGYILYLGDGVLWSEQTGDQSQAPKGWIPMGKYPAGGTEHSVTYPG